MRSKRSLLLIGLALLLFASAAYIGLLRFGYLARLRPQFTIEQRVAQYGPAARARLQPRFEATGVTYPPASLTLLALKRERRMELWAPDAKRQLRLVHTYAISGMSGGPGPKLKEGDRHVPEGIYAIESLNPNSLYHLSLRIGYPNAYDRAQARADGRANLGGDIMIHGGSASIGCLAMGDEAAEDLFLMAQDTGLANIRVILAPCDFRRGESVDLSELPRWTAQLHEEIRGAIMTLR